MKIAKKLWMILLLLVLGACEPNDVDVPVSDEPIQEVVEDQSFFEEHNISIVSYEEFTFLDEVESFEIPVDTFMLDGVYYASISDIAEHMNYAFLSNKWRMKKYTTEFTDEYYHMYNTSNTIDMKFYYDGRVEYDTEQFYMSEFDGWRDAGYDANWATATIDINHNVEYQKYFNPIPDSTRPAERFPYHKEFDLADFGVSAVYEEELYLPLHIISFMMNGFEGLNYSIEDDTFYLTPYEDYGTKIPMDLLALTPANKAYFIGWFDFVYNEYYFSKDVYIDLYNELKVVTYEEMRQATNWSDFYKAFFTMIAQLKDHHTYKGSLAQANPSIESAYWSMADAHYEEGNIPSNYYASDFAYEVLDGNILWLRIGTFSTGYSDETKELIDTLQPSAVIYDVRGNTGGYIHHSYNLIGTMSNEFYSYEMDQEGYVTTYFIEMQDDEWYSGPTYVLSNELSFSAASQFIQVVKDNELATIVGESHGGGHSAVIHMYLPDGSILHISITDVGMIGKTREWIDFGTVPDYYVKDEFINGVDQILDYTLGMIEEDLS